MDIQNQTPNRQPADFLTVDEFKAKINKTGVEAQVVKNPNTQKVFLAIGELRFKVQQNFDGSKPFSILVPRGATMDQACLVNTTNTNNVLFTL